MARPYGLPAGSRPLITPLVKPGATDSTVYTDEIMQIINQISATGEPVSFPDPIGRISGADHMARGALLIERASDGALFTALSNGEILGPIQGAGGFPTPSYKDARMMDVGTWKNPRISAPPSGLPTGTLPGGFVYDPERTSQDDSPAPATEGVSLLTVAGLAGALYFATR